ncbi:rheacalcin-1 [Penaeus vannamei]|uniref:rheacalcin-1 n=1 Tax=Penaeus vannamei TaxID=6689 RepID=UPI00387F67B9
MMGVNILRALAVVASLLPAVLAGRCRPEYHSLAGTCLKLVMPQSLTWREALNLCQAEDPPADLLKITRPEVLESVSRFINTHFAGESTQKASLWVGGSGINKEWSWVDGSKLSVKSNMWHPDEPSQGTRGYTKLVVVGDLHNRRYLVADGDAALATGYICEH